MSLLDQVPSLQSRLETIYDDRATTALSAIENEFADLISKQQVSKQQVIGSSEGKTPLWSERDVVLITYADQVQESASEPNNNSRSPLAALRYWLKDNDLDKLLNTVHLLPFCPYSSDDGFSVIDYMAVDPNSGRWEDISALEQDFELMFDLVLNHISQHSDWYQAYLRGESPYDRFFTEADPSLDYSEVIRPRSLPLLTPAEVNGSQRHVWTTFSEDQIDLNYAEPMVLARMLRIFVEYALRGARIIRLDAIAFLWKEQGTNCLHHAKTHEIVKLMREVLEVFAPRALVLTETNVPHNENVSYFGASSTSHAEAASAAGDEAHMVYQFSLPPLLLDGFLSGDASAICEWLSNLAPPPEGCTFFNFTASHDGVGMRPLEGLVSTERIMKLVDAVKARGGRINTRRAADGTDVPYELCTTYFEALAPNSVADDAPGDNKQQRELHVRRFLASQAVMLGLQGMPAIYFHSLVGSPNDTANADSSGINRRLNRHKYQRDELDRLLSDPLLNDTANQQRQVFDGYRELIAKRIVEPPFDPSATQEVIPQSSSSLLAFERVTLDQKRRVLVIVNFSETKQKADLPEAYQRSPKDLLSEKEIPTGRCFSIEPGQAVWLTV